MFKDLDTVLNRFIKLSVEELHAVHERVRIHKIDKNVCLIDDHKIADDILFVRKGYLRTYFIKGGEEITRDISSVNSFFTALTSFITKKPSFEIISTITNCEVLMISREDLNYLYSKYNQRKNFPYLPLMQFLLLL